MRRPYELVVVGHDEFSDGVLQRLGTADRARLAGLDDAGRPRFLAGRKAVLAAVARLLGGPLHGITVDALCAACGLPHGRPVVSGAAVALHVSVGHAAGSAFAVASRVPIGIDAESRGTPQGRVDAISAVTGYRGPDPLSRWTATEAILKADGRGLRVDPRDVLVGRGHGQVLDRAVRYRLHRHRDLAGCVVTVAWADQAPVEGGNPGNSGRSSQASNTASRGAPANRAASRRKSSVDAAP